MYLIQMDHVVYERRGGGLFTLPEAVREVYGVRGCRILRADGSTAVLQAGSAYAVTHVRRDGREREVIRRRMCWASSHAH